MAQSDDVTALAEDEGHREPLPEGEARLVLHEGPVTVTFEGDEEAVHEQLLEHLTESFDMSIEELEADMSEIPTPRSGEGLVSADEFYE